MHVKRRNIYNIIKDIIIFYIMCLYLFINKCSFLFCINQAEFQIDEKKYGFKHLIKISEQYSNQILIDDYKK